MTNDIAEKLKALPDGFIKEVRTREGSYESVKPAIKISDLKALADEVLELKAMLADLFGVIGGAETITLENGIEYRQDEFGWRNPFGSLENGYDEAAKNIDLLNCFADPDQILEAYRALREETK